MKQLKGSSFDGMLIYLPDPYVFQWHNDYRPFYNVYWAMQSLSTDDFININEGPLNTFYWEQI